MPPNPAIDELLQRWREAARRGETLSINDLCHDHPELRGEVERRLADLPWPEPATPPGGATVREDSGSPPLESVASVPLEVGARPVPGYRLTRFINGGGFGEVWQAEGPGRMPVAMKFVRLTAKGGAIELRSLELLRSIRHPNLMATFGTWQSDNRLISAMELAEGTLLDRLTRARQAGQPGIPFEELIGYMTEAARAIDHLNAPRHTVEGRPNVGVQHRDIKPQNLLLV